MIKFAVRKAADFFSRFYWESKVHYKYSESHKLVLWMSVFR